MKPTVNQHETNNGASAESSKNLAQQFFFRTYKGMFHGILRWPKLDSLWKQVIASKADWYIYSLAEAPPEQTVSADYKTIGTRPIRPDAADKVTGRALFSADLRLPGMLYGKMLRDSKHYEKSVELLEKGLTKVKDRKRDLYVHLAHSHMELGQFVITGGVLSVPSQQSSASSTISSVG